MFCTMFAPGCSPYAYAPYGRRAYCAPRSSCGPCFSSPCANPLFIIGALMFLPTIFKLFFFGIGLALHVAPIFIIAAITHSLFNDESGNAWCHQAKTTATATDKKMDQKKEEEEEEPAVVLHEDGAAKIKIDSDKITIVLAVPGIRSADLKVNVVDDRVLRIKGESKTGTDVYKVARDIQLPSIDMSTLSATHEDGVLSIVVKRKVREVTIPVTITPSSTAEAAPALSGTPTAASSTPPAKEDEWEPLPKAD